MTNARRIFWIVIGLVGVPAPAVSQAPLFLIDPDTEIESVAFRFSEGSSIETSRLREQVVLSGPGPFHGLRSALGVLPLISSPSRDRFDPPSLLRDVVRLERFYRDEGFPEVSVDYDVVLDPAKNSVTVAYVIAEGPPLVLDTILVQPAGGAPMLDLLPEELHASWSVLQGEMAADRGARLNGALRARQRDRVINWLQDRGYPYPTATVRTEPTGAVGGGHGMRLILDLQTGARMRIGEITIEGNRRLETPVLLREVPLAEGDWYSRARLVAGQSELFGLDMVRIAVTGSEPDSLLDDRVNVRLRITEGSLHVLSGRAGWGMGSGVSADVSWSHRDFLGGARTLEISTLARTGLLAPEATRSRRYGLSFSVRQPWLFDHRVEGVFRPFVEYRDDLRDESVHYGAESSAHYQRGPGRNVSLRYALTSRRVIRAGAGVILGQDADFASLLAALDTLDLDRRTSSFSAAGRWARASAVAITPRIDWSVYGSAEIAGPAGLSTIEYGKVVGDATVIVPVGAGVAVRSRLGGGRVLPFGISRPAADGSNRLENYFKLRDAVLTAGGSQDVRGWGTDLLGPKAPDVVTIDGSAVATPRYLPLGGLARWTGSVQVEVPLPFFGRPHGLHTFLDAGRVWTPDGRFLPTELPLVPEQLGDRVRFGTGLGVSIGTPVGPVQLDLGYKLNPSTLDLRDASAVGLALFNGDPITDIPAEGIRRWHLHLSIGGLS